VQRKRNPAIIGWVWLSY